MPSVRSINKHLKRLKRLTRSIFEVFIRTETIAQSQSKWDRLAEENARYYVFTDQGTSITEPAFRLAGQHDYDHLIAQDRLLNERLAPFSSRTVLEIGSGIGRITEFLADAFGSVSGIDISPQMIERAKERLKNRPNLTLIATDGTTYPFPRASFDFVFSVIVFQHMPSKEVIQKNFREIGRVLKQTGIAKIQLRGVPTDKTSWFYGPAFASAEVPNLLKGTGLSLLRHEGEGTKYFWVWLTKA